MVENDIANWMSKHIQVYRLTHSTQEVGPTADVSHRVTHNSTQHVDRP